MEQKVVQIREVVWMGSRILSIVIGVLGLVLMLWYRETSGNMSQQLGLLAIGFYCVGIAVGMALVVWVPKKPASK
jgi:FtsH-binding integral membrane protein